MRLEQQLLPSDCEMRTLQVGYRFLEIARNGTDVVPVASRRLCRHTPRKPLDDVDQ
jgi:hypothetical protein